MRRGNQVLYLMAATVNDNNHRPSFNCPLIIKAKCIGSMILDDPPRHLVMSPPPCMEFTKYTADATRAKDPSVSQRMHYIDKRGS